MLHSFFIHTADPEGLFCITTRNHTETKEDPWETTRGIMPDILDKRDMFLSKFHETLALAKAATISSGVDYTSRLHVAELELFCNVFTESQYRDFKYKGDVALFYTSSANYPVDVTPFTRLPPFVGMIQASETGLRAILRSRTSLNGAGDSISMGGDSNPPLDTDAFQIHISELGNAQCLPAWRCNMFFSIHTHNQRPINYSGKSSMGCIQF